MLIINQEQSQALAQNLFQESFRGDVRRQLQAVGPRDAVSSRQCETNMEWSPSGTSRRRCTNTWRAWSRREAGGWRTHMIRGDTRINYPNMNYSSYWCWYWYSLRNNDLLLGTSSIPSTGACSGAEPPPSCSRQDCNQYWQFGPRPCRDKHRLVPIVHHNIIRHK